MSKSWCSIASIYLFEKIYVSANQQDLDVFQAVAEHPSLRRHVKTLSYDGTFFYPEMAKRDYMRNLLKEKPPESFFALDNIAYSYPNRDIEHWIRHTPRNASSNSKWAKFLNCKFINDGFYKYQDHAYKQKELLASGKFPKILINGLKCLESLRSITVRSRWQELQNLDDCHTGSPLARSWNIFHLRPKSWSWVPIDGKSFVKCSRTSFG